MFVDASGWAAIADPRQQHHVAAAARLRQFSTAGRAVVTTSYVLNELTALLNSPVRLPRDQQIQFIADLRASPTVDIVFIDAAPDAAAWQLWASRPDKAWSLVDCASFVVMQQRGLTEALTSDHHFEQAGFVRLLK